MYFYTSTNTKEDLNESDSLNGLLFKEIFKSKIYNYIPEMQIKKGDIVVDLGAHIGIFSKYAIVQEAERVMAFEMEPRYFTCLRKNVRSTDYLFNCVLLDQPYVKYKLDNEVIINGFDFKHFYNGGLFSKIDFFKIDIMGKELVFLNSLKYSHFNIIEKLSIKFYNLSDENKIKIVNQLKDFGFIYQYNLLVENSSIQFIYFWK